MLSTFPKSFYNNSPWSSLSSSRIDKVLREQDWTKCPPPPLSHIIINAKVGRLWLITESTALILILLIVVKQLRYYVAMCIFLLCYDTASAGWSPWCCRCSFWLISPSWCSQRPRHLDLDNIYWPGQGRHLLRAPSYQKQSVIIHQ